MNLAFLNILNVDSENEIYIDEFAQTLYVRKSEDETFDPVPHILFSYALLPLCWTGPLSEYKSGHG